MSEKSDEAYRTIGEAAGEVGVPAHVLRFWETKFSQIRPVKRANGRRFYRPSDVALLRALKSLLHDQGMTIRGAQRVLKERGVAAVAVSARATPPETPPETPPAASPTVDDAPLMTATSRDEAAERVPPARRDELENVLDDLASARAVLERVLGGSKP